MNETLLIIIFYILLIDSMAANLIAWTGHNKWFMRTFAPISKYFPLTKGWTTYYLALVLWIGYILNGVGIL